MQHSRKVIKEDLLQLSSTLGKMLKRRFGKGPDSCIISYKFNKLTVIIQRFITPAEDTLIENNNINLAYHLRGAIMETVLQEFEQEVSNVLGLNFDQCYHDWNYDTNIGIVYLEHEKVETSKERIIFPHLKERLFEEIINISSEVHKSPQSLEIMRINHNLFAVACTGVVLGIERVLYEKDQFDILQERSREIKKQYIERKKEFESIFHCQIKGIFMTWNYEYDRSYIFFYLS